MGPRLATLLLPLVLAACTQVARIDSEPMPLSAQEKTVVHTKVDESRKAKEWKDAWNQAVLAGAERQRLEDIAAEAAADGDGDAKAMFRELRSRGWSLGDAARRRIDQAVQAAEAEKEYGDATEILVLSAEDPPAFARAWELYARAPASEAPSVLKEIRRARESFERDEEARKAAEGNR